jgi:hypothetical protein
MKQKDIVVLATIVVVAAVFSAIVSGKVFNSPSHKLKAPEVKPISANFPDIKNDSNYKSFFNERALDPTQLIQIGTSQNATPFNAATPN